MTGLPNGLSDQTAWHTPDTVKFHIEAPFRTLDVKSRIEAVAKGLRWQIVEF